MKYQEDDITHDGPVLSHTDHDNPFPPGVPVEVYDTTGVPLSPHTLTLIKKRAEAMRRAIKTCTN